MTAIIQAFPLGNQWPTIDPFLFVAHHRDAYPPGTEDMGPDAPLDGRQLGQDFADVDGWNMYHGRVVPGFPQHPHRGFETITYGRHGFIDHSDSLGARARFGRGDVQWMTAGSGIVHAEMFPLLNRDEPNRAELFQIWLNLPRDDKMVDPYFTMLWSEDIPKLVTADDAGRTVEVTVIAGALPGAEPPAPPPNSWAAREDAMVGLWHIVLAPGAAWELPTATEDIGRLLYAFSGSSVEINGEGLEAGHGAAIDAAMATTLVGGPEGVEILILQGRPIGEPVAQYGPFVLNDRAGVELAFSDYQRTQFGGWPWPSDGPVHDRDETRFAVHPDGTHEKPSIAEPAETDADAPSRSG